VHILGVRLATVTAAAEAKSGICIRSFKGWAEAPMSGVGGEVEMCAVHCSDECEDGVVRWIWLDSRGLLLHTANIPSRTDGLILDRDLRNARRFWRSPRKAEVVSVCMCPPPASDSGGFGPVRMPKDPGDMSTVEEPGLAVRARSLCSSLRSSMYCTLQARTGTRRVLQKTPVPQPRLSGLLSSHR